MPFSEASARHTRLSDTQCGGLRTQSALWGPSYRGREEEMDRIAATRGWGQELKLCPHLAGTEETPLGLLQTQGTARGGCPALEVAGSE